MRPTSLQPSPRVLGDGVPTNVVGSGNVTSDGGSIPEETATGRLDEAANLSQRHLTTGTGDTKGVGLQVEVADLLRR